MGIFGTLQYLLVAFPTTVGQCSIRGPFCDARRMVSILLPKVTTARLLSQ